MPLWILLFRVGSAWSVDGAFYNEDVCYERIAELGADYAACLPNLTRIGD